MSHRAKRSAAFAATLSLALMAATLATAALTSSATGGPQPVAAATLTAPSTPDAQPGPCNLLPIWSQPITLTWNATSSTFADGQSVLRATTSNGSYTPIATLSAAATNYTDTTTAASTTYYYAIRATKLNWATDSAQSPAATTKNILCL